MGYDMYMTKVKKEKLEFLKKTFKDLSLSDLWNNQFITFLTEDELSKEYEIKVTYLNYVIVCNEDIWSNLDIFSEYFSKNNICCDCDECIELSKNEVINMFNYLDNYLKTTLFDKLDEYDESNISKRFLVYKKLKKIIQTIENDEIVLFHHNW